MTRPLLRPFARYARLFDPPGAAGFVAAGFASRLTTSMVVVGLVLSVTGHGAGYAAAGLTAASLVLASGLALPVAGRLYDRYGQHRVLVQVTAAFSVTMAGLICAIAAGAPPWLLALLAAAAGVPMPVTGPLVRARWTRLYQGTERLRVAYGFESATIELVYIVGPVLVTALVTGIGWLAGLGAVVACAAGGSLALAAQRGTEPEPCRAAAGRRSAWPLRLPSLRALFLTRFCIGGVLGSMPVATIAFASAQHGRALSGLLLGAWGTTSMLAGLCYGALRARAPLHRRLMVSVALFAAGGLPLLAVRGLVGLAGALVLAGVAMAPVTVSAMEVMQRAAPAAMLTETVSWDATFLAFGMTGGTALAGAIAAHLPAGRIYAIPVGCELLALLAVLAGRGAIAAGLRAADQAAAQPAPATEAW